FPAPVACLAARTGGGSAVGLDNGPIMVWNAEGSDTTIDFVGPARLRCPTALLFLDRNTLVVCQGSAEVAPSRWARDLMEHGYSVWASHASRSGGKQTCLGAGLAFPNGLLADESGSGLIVAESWKHRLVRLSPEGLAMPK